MRRANVLRSGSPVVLFFALVTAAVTVPGTAASAGSETGAFTGLPSCIAHAFPQLPEPNDIYYAPGCTGHDEPELDPVSSAPGSAKDLTWTVMLPRDGSHPVADSGVFWFGSTVNEPASWFGEAYAELQFYPDSIVKKCFDNGGYSQRFAPNTYTACSPVWQINPKSLAETAAFNGMLHRGSTTQPLVMHAGDTVEVHFYVTHAEDGFHETVTDVTTGQRGTIVLNSVKYGPFMPVYGSQKIGNALKWGLVNDTPMAFVWEIGHTSDFANPAAVFCLPGDPSCTSYNAATWAGFEPLRITSVTFGDGSHPQKWAVASDYGGTAEVNQYCPTYGVPFCTYPWYSRARDGSWNYGVDYRDTVADYGKAAQFATDLKCGGPFGRDSNYCVTVLG
jgi:hypothetical protein